MTRAVLAVLICGLLAGCGLGETASSVAAGGSTEVQQAQQGIKTEARVKEQLDAAAKLDSERRAAAEETAQ